MFVTGGTGFIGSNLIRDLLFRPYHEAVLNIDKLTYAGTLRNLEGIDQHPRYHFTHADVCDTATSASLFAENQCREVVHCAAESHVVQSI